MTISGFDVKLRFLGSLWLIDTVKDKNQEAIWFHGIFRGDTKMVKRIIGIVCSFASLFGLIIMVRPRGQAFTVMQGGLLTLALVFLVYTIFEEIKSYCEQKPLTMTRDSKIHDYMFNWLAQGGRAVIFTHNLTWGENKKIKDLLRSKAEHNELTICLPKKTTLVEELERIGAEVCVYPELDHTPQASFTIVRKGRLDSRVAVGRRMKNKHVIEEFALGEHPVFHVANDLTDIIIKFNRWKKENKQ